MSINPFSFINTIMSDIRTFMYNVGLFLIIAILTAIIELLVGFIFGVRTITGRRTILFTNLITNMSANLLIYIIEKIELVHLFALSNLVIEIVIVFVEMLVYYNVIKNEENIFYVYNKTNKKSTRLYLYFLLSLVSNYVSFTIGYFTIYTIYRVNQF